MEGKAVQKEFVGMQRSIRAEITGETNEVDADWRSTSLLLHREIECTSAHIHRLTVAFIIDSKISRLWRENRGASRHQGFSKGTIEGIESGGFLRFNVNSK
jgi:hypothetical protein